MLSGVRAVSQTSSSVVLMFTSTCAMSGGTNTKAFGYAPANVTRVVLSFRGGEGSARTFAAGWAGSGIRLWSASLPGDLGLPLPAITATGYDAAGQVVERVKLGSSNFC